MKPLLILCLFLALAPQAFAQDSHMTKSQRKSYKLMQSLCNYYDGEKYDTLQRGAVFQRFVYFDNILVDSSTTRKRKRIQSFDWLFARVIHFIDSVGVVNLDAKPTLYFKNNTSYFYPFAKKSFGGLHKFLPQTLTYFDKRNPTKPIGTLFFESRTHKLVSWVIINQGGHYYPLSFNLL
ncbi:hypothetical protein [Hymenobacter arcticus]